MERVLEAGSSVLIFAEGGFNNTENLLVLKLFSSPYILACHTGCEIVPIAPLHEYGSKDIFINVGNAINLAQYENKEQALAVLRDELATLLYENMEKNGSKLIRGKMINDIRMDFMEERRREYLNTKWTRDVWDEELTRYLDEKDKELLAIEKDIAGMEIKFQNAFLAKYILNKKSDFKYDFKKYMHDNWRKEQ